MLGTVEESEVWFEIFLNPGLSSPCSFQRKTKQVKTSKRLDGVIELRPFKG
jgi:hypothetical protein